METFSEPDVEIDICSQCGGRFLDKGELDELATGMAGEIEYCSIDADPHDDTFPVRACPKCTDQEMRKINLLKLSELIFDYCPRCEGFFLDKGELSRMDWELTQLSGAGFGEEFRDTIDGHLVRLNRVRDVLVVGGEFGALSQQVEYFQVVTYLVEPLGVGLRITRERWSSKLAKLFGLFKGQDLEVGNKPFDSAFVVQCDNEDKTRTILSPELQAALLDFDTRKPRLFAQSFLSKLTSKSTSGAITVRDSRIEYLEGPYAVSTAKPEADAIIQDLLGLAALLERSSG
jgi:Zn-finger nucleic acid-binding protein